MRDQSTTVVRSFISYSVLINKFIALRRERSLADIAFGQLRTYMFGAVLIVIIIPGEDVGKEKELHHHKENEKLDEDNHPQSASDGHFLESGVIEHPYVSDAGGYAVKYVGMRSAHGREWCVYRLTMER